MFPSDPSCMEPNYVSLLSNIICKVVTKVLYYSREGGAGVRAASLLNLEGSPGILRGTVGFPAGGV
jgi:hypothetical protein